MSKFTNYFNDKKDQIKTAIRFENKFPFFFLSMTLIVIITVLIRLTPVVNDVFLIKAFDGWIQYDSTKYIIDNGAYEFFNWWSTKSWYPVGVNRGHLRPGLLFSGAAFYYVLNFLGFSVTPMLACFYFPAFMGALTVVVMYFLGKEVLDKRTGLLAAFFLAVSPGHMQRTVAGFYDNETVGIFAFLLLFLYFMRGIKSRKLWHGIVSGVSLGFLSLSWGALQFPFLLLPLITLVMILMNKYEEQMLVMYALSIGVGLLIYTMNRFFIWGTFFEFVEVVVPLLWLGALILYNILYIKRGTSIYQKTLRLIKWSIVPLAVVFIILLWYYPESLPFGMGWRVYSIINPNFRSTLNIVASVGEQQPSAWSVFYYNSQITLLLMIPGFYFAFRRNSLDDVLMVILVILLYYFTGSMIRIILLFAPAISLIAAYGLSNILRFFGSLMQEEKNVSRRRKKQLSRTVGKPEGITVYAIVGLLLFVQVNHAVGISTRQMGYSELVAGGVYHDWEEALTWMKYNIDPNDPVVSWWDYGYWITVIGNSTTVNDNGTGNQTRIGLTGMAFMQTNERYSAEIFRWLGAEYVVVYFGHLINGLGGDEGKWPWMLRICNDNAERYRNDGYYHDNWYSETEVFNEGDYINSTSGGYRDAWFQSQLVKLMFSDAPTSMAAATTQTGAFYASEIEGSEQYGKQPRVDDEGNLWSTHIPENGQYNFQFFKQAYYSQNQLVKIFKMDYTALDSSFEVNDPYMEDNGYGFLKVENTGEMDINVENLYLNDEQFNFTMDGASSTIKPNQEKYIIFDTSEYDNTFTDSNTVFSASIQASVDRADGSKYTFSNNSHSTEIIIDEDDYISSSIRIKQDQSSLIHNPETTTNEDNEIEFFIEVENTGEKPIIINEFQIFDGLDFRKKNSSNTFSFGVNNDEKNKLEQSSYTGKDFIIAPGDTERYWFADNVAPEDTLHNTRFVGVFTNSEDRDEIHMSFNQKDYNLEIVNSGEYTNLPEKAYLYDYNYYETFNLNHQRFYMDYSEESYLYEDGTLKLSVRNNGKDTIALQNVFIDDIPLSGDKWSVDGGLDQEFIAPNQKRVIRANLDNVERNTPVKITVTGENVITCTSATTFLTPVNQTAMIDVYIEDFSRTSLFTDEVLKLVVKNVGLETLSLDSLTLNGSSAIPLTGDNIIDGSNPGDLELKPNEVALVDVEISNFKINQSNYLDIVVNTNKTFASAELTLESRLPGQYKDIFINLIVDGDPISGSIIPQDGYTEVSAYNNELKGLFTVIEGQIATIDSISINTTNTGDFVYIPSSEIVFTDESGNEIVEWEFENTLKYPQFELFYFSINLFDAIGENIEEDESVWVRIITTQGYEELIELKAKI